ncbi:MAG TPA: nickel-dependent hydrogenase large subunit [Candidatus Paceibacterota bacterium]|nr:nickel-dependent hydrogenase large subunit [Verrucomicrobiota bacterium]HRY49326.1 nickel-dependent hydrogenase large subunit [Candidatus Paceibacterota bacterium]HSA03285.1 nickel-dependent hydrogenase large subunit [Candidatus Paceibacterota bacterium]
MATRTITLDPVTRIEGHLRIDVEVDGDRVAQAWSSAQMWRGIEVIMRGRPPQDAWAFAQRFCGVCTTVHAISSIRAVEHALGVEIPLNAQFVRNIMIAQHSVQDHIVHFYHLAALDWVDLVSALQADPRKTARLAQDFSAWPGNSETEFKAVQDRLRAFVQSGRLGIFGSGYWGHPAMKLSPEQNLMILAHYLTAFDFQRKAAQAVAVLGGKNPHIQNLVVGGVATALNLENMATTNLERLVLLRGLLEESRAFVQQVFYPDLLAIAGAYKEWFGLGAGVTNFLAVPEFPEDGVNSRFALGGGIIQDGNLDGHRVLQNHADQEIINGIEESVARAWYEDSKPAHPWQAQTRPQPGEFKADGKYSWCKAPRLAGQPVQVGPLAQILTNYAAGNPRVQSLVNETNGFLGIRIKDYLSTMGRFVARAIRTRIMADLSLEYVDKLIQNLGAGDSTYANPTEIPRGEFRGVGFHEAPRGSLSHWIVIQNQKIENYQAVVPTTWNASPRDEQGVPGPYEASLAGTPIADPEKPLEVLRTLHSFDPCIACAVHAINPAGEEIVQVKVQ